jgi:hypothetical protein
VNRNPSATAFLCGRVVKTLDTLTDMRNVAAIIAQDARENQAGVDVISVGPVYGSGPRDAPPFRLCLPDGIASRFRFQRCTGGRDLPARRLKTVRRLIAMAEENMRAITN